MKLQEFLNETLREIIAGVKDTQAYAKDNGAQVNPSGSYKPTTKNSVPGSGGGYIPIQEVEFDVAVTSTDTSETQAGAGVFVAALGLGVKDKSGITNSCVSRVRFSVPLVLPVNMNE